MNVRKWFISKTICSECEDDSQFIWSRKKIEENQTSSKCDNKFSLNDPWHQHKFSHLNSVNESMFLTVFEFRKSSYFFIRKYSHLLLSLSLSLSFRAHAFFVPEFGNSWALDYRSNERQKGFQIRRPHQEETSKMKRETNDPKPTANIEMFLVHQNTFVWIDFGMC